MKVSAYYKCRMCGQGILVAYHEPAEADPVTEFDLRTMLVPHRPDRSPERWEHRLAQQIMHKCLHHHERGPGRRGIADLQGVEFREDTPQDDGKKP